MGVWEGVSIAFHHMVRRVVFFSHSLPIEICNSTCGLRDGWTGWVTCLLLIFFASLWIRLHLGVMGVELSSICLCVLIVKSRLD